MDSLFPLTVSQEQIPSIACLQYLRDYLIEADERNLVAAIDAGPWNLEWKRRRQPYGGAYGSAGDEAVPPIPVWAHPLRDRLLAEGITTQPFDQMLVNEYLPGQGIALHRDYRPYGRTVVSISLLSACVMDFRHPSSARHEQLLLEPRSLVALHDAARYEWQHGIAARKTDSWGGITFARRRRLSITFRFVERHAAVRKLRTG